MNSIAQTTELNDCGCCEGISAETPMRIENRPGLSAIVYRVGTHAQFKEMLHARLSASGQSALAGFTTRDNDDFSIALLDAWATVGDVLTFYQERIANEAYLRTATERLSVLELARLINYELRPGVAAGTYLAFTIEEAPGAAGQVLAVGTSAQIAPEPLPPITICAGAKVQSIPGPGEQAQTFETVAAITARPEWNAIKPRLTQPQKIAAFLRRALIFQGTATDIKKGDMLVALPVNPLKPPQKVVNVTTDDDAKTTRVDLEMPPADLPLYERPSGLTKGQVNEFAPKAELTTETTRRIISETWDEPDLSALVTMQNWKASSLSASIRKEIAAQNLAATPQVFVYRQKAAVFGYNAPKKPTYAKHPPAPDDPFLWAEWDLDHESATLLFLDRAYEGITPGSYVTVEKGSKSKTIQVKSVTTLPRTAYGISSKTTLLTLAESWWDVIPSSGKAVRVQTKAIVSSGSTAVSVGSANLFQLAAFRDVTVYAQSESLPLAELPIMTPLRPTQIVNQGVTLDGPFLGLSNGQRVVLKGERDDLKGVYTSETLTLKAVIVEAGFTVLTFNEQLAYPYVRKTITINANVATATHGETVQETLGGGDGTQAFQRFTLRQPPLTYVSSANPSGAQSTLEVRVNDILWSEVSDFFGHGPDDRIYTTQLDDKSNTTVIFGDGINGARLPSGQENIKAKYRKGIGLSGLVKADQLTQLMTRPFGVKGVTNPLAPNGAANPEQLADARRNAPLTVLTLGRIVSLQDYEDFARTFSGVDKALATWTWFGEKRGVFVTVAGPNGAQVSAGSDLYKNLLQAMKGSGNPLVPLQVESYRAGLFRLAAALKIDSTYVPEKVLEQAQQKVRDTFSFAARTFGQPVHLSEVIAVLQSVPGVVAVNVTALYRSNEAPELKEHLAAAVPQPARTQVIPAEILTLDLQPLELGTFQ
jgi:predicted phage baseplate assembly protein